MSIIGQGIDIVDIPEMGRWVDDPLNPLVPRCFVQEELDEVGNGPGRIKDLAGRFAAKEAVLKALGTGFGAGVGLSDVMTHREPGGLVRVRLRGGAADSATEQGITKWHVSISHTDAIAAASAMGIGCTNDGQGGNHH